jgi:hypothetical protein
MLIAFMAVRLFRERNGIMAKLSQKARNSTELQREVFRLAEIEHGLSLPVLVRTRGIALSTLKGWRNGAAMPVWAIGELRLPDDLSSLLLSPWKRHIGTDEDTESDFDDAADAAGELVTAVRKARHPKSPGGVAIVHTEKAQIIPLARAAAAKARKVAA